MKHFKDPVTKKLYGFEEDGSQDHLIPPGVVPVPPVDLPAAVDEVHRLKVTPESRRGERDALLLETDWTQLPDVPITAASKAAFETYRQALRDVPQQPQFPNNVNWPNKPTYVKT